MSRSTGNLALDVLVRQAESRLVETAHDDAAAAVAAVAARAAATEATWGKPLAAHPSLDADYSTSRNTWPPVSGFLHRTAADAADAGAGGLATEPIADEPLSSDTPPGCIVHGLCTQQMPPPRPAPQPQSLVTPQSHAPVAAPTAGLSEDCQFNLARSLKIWVAGQLSAMGDMQRAALARLQSQLDRHRADFQAGRKQLREDLAEALATQRQVVEARLGVPLAGAFLGRSGDESGTGTPKPTAQFDIERWEDHVRNTASALQAMQAKTAELARLAACQGDIDEALRRALAKHSAELAAQRSELWDLGRELELCTRALQEREVHEFQPAAEPSPDMDAQHVVLQDQVSDLGDSVLGLEVKLTEGLDKASEEQAKARTALRTALSQHERDHEALREDLRRLERELRVQLTQVGERETVAHETVEQSIAARVANEIAPFEARHAALQPSLEAVCGSGQSLEPRATRRSSGLSTRDDQQQAAVAVATAAASATDALSTQFHALQEDLHHLARELPREAELREGQARDTAARLDDLGKSMDMLRQGLSSAEMSRVALSSDVMSQVELSHTNFQDLSSQLDKDRLVLEQLTSNQVNVRNELSEYGERVQVHDAVIDELREFSSYLANFSVQGDRTIGVGLERSSQTVELERSAIQKLVEDQASDQRAVQNELQTLSGQFQEEYAAVHKELEEFSNRLTRDRRLSGHAVLWDSLAADHSVVRNELAELSSSLRKQRQDHACDQSQQKLQTLESSLHHELWDFKQEQSTDWSKRECFLVDQLAAVEKTFYEELHELKCQVKQDATVPEPDRDTMQQLVRDEIQELSGQLYGEHVAASVGPSVDKLTELGKQLKEECEQVREHGERVQEEVHSASEELRVFGNQLANQGSTWKSVGLEHGARMDFMEVELRDLKSEVCNLEVCQDGSGHAPVASDAESASDGMGPLAEQKLHMGVSHNDWLLQMIDTEREERLMLKQSIDAERLARKEAADQEAWIRDRDQAQMKKELVKAIGMQLSRALQDAQAEYKVYAEEAIERVTGQVNHVSACASRTEGTEKEGESEFNDANSQALDEMEREITSLREAMKSKQGEAESGMTSLKDGLEEVNCKVCDLEGRVEVIEKSELGLKGEELEAHSSRATRRRSQALNTFVKRTLYEELYSSIVEELGDHVSRIRSDCENLGHDIREAAQKIEDLNEKWEEAEGYNENWLERLQGKFKDLDLKLSKVEAAKGQTSRDAEARRGALTLDEDALRQLQMPRKSVVFPPPSRRSTVDGMNVRGSLQSEARTSTLSHDSRMSAMTQGMSER